MYEVLDKITIKFETLHQFSVVKSCCVSKKNLLEVVLYILYKLMVGLLWHSNEENAKMTSIFKHQNASSTKEYYNFALAG